ncbi:MAG: divergent polysaccharide deacetylase family protein, partial [Candidatus Omnitrophica bacterium]|nr:divergent polysaccharide deacetylase family protein [Candidatus Omnitrophota bacterium]
AVTGIMREYKKNKIDIPAIKRPDLPVKRKATAPGKTQIALIIDDVGWNKAIIKEIEKINRPLTLSLLPKAQYSRDIFEMLKDKDSFELILHIPMEPAPPSECRDKGLIKTTMSDEEIIRQFNDDLKGYYPHIRGLNNHMGSAFTADEEKMRVLLKEMRAKKMFFVDSMTTRQSKGFKLAKEMGIRTAQRHVFLDNESTSEYIEKQIRELVETSREQGSAIGLGHARKNTIAVLQKIIPELEKEGIEIVPVSSLLE